MKHLPYFIGFLLAVSCIGQRNDKMITLGSLLGEMVSFDEATRFPSPHYSSHQVSSHDRRSVSPDSPGWFANDDGFGIERIDTVDGRIEKVMLDEKGPGVITRIWITTLDKRGTWRFYFDHSTTPGWTIPAYDLMKFGIPELGPGLLQPHTSYTAEGKGGSTLFLPIPFSENCKITFEDEKGIEPTPKYYHINYRKYDAGTKIETFSQEVIDNSRQLITKTDQLLHDPPEAKIDSALNVTKDLASGDTLKMKLPEGENAVSVIQFNIEVDDTSEFDQALREIISLADFDGKQTCWIPLGDFSGGGFGARYVKSWFLASDGKGKVVSRWLMPYQSSGEIALVNTHEKKVRANIKAGISTYEWDNRSLYFHASWKQARNLVLCTDPLNDTTCMDWNFVTLTGKGVYKGDVLSLYNHAPEWYGEGDEKIWVDSDTFPSHFGTGTEDYYNSSWAPVVPFQTPFGGAPRADLESSHGHNTFFRTRNLDGIPFSEKLIFDIELIGWKKGTVDYATTVYWYGDQHSTATGASGFPGTGMTGESGSPCSRTSLENKGNPAFSASLKTEATGNPITQKENLTSK